MEFTIPLPQNLALRIGEINAGRNHYPTAHLQKGFVLIDHGRDLAEEAIGFGLPVLQLGLQTLFPGGVTLTGSSSGSTWHITAMFKMNLLEKISKNGDGNIDSRTLYSLKNLAAAAIRGLPGMRKGLTILSSGLRRLFRWETVYAQASISVDLKVDYILDSATGTLQVEINPLGQPTGITRVSVMNEQGAHHFDVYRDSSGAFLNGPQIGCWDEVGAREAWFESKTCQVVFKLGQVEGARLFRGRELVGSRLAWAGFGYTFPPSNLKFRYTLSLGRWA